jgi:hypothetical protein
MTYYVSNTALLLTAAHIQQAGKPEIEQNTQQYI